ncbi:helix-turn-helix domain-containing protein [Pasteurella multocida]|uniref:helix-turn-helix domain-containing protein n=1 Tax=Pasteurella multocida TaxID=747 RepID=UPI002A519C41|nr:helix-turn-helix domain-containing protein [Pasteurella multocida]MDY0577112.1 DNA-packaging protein [Pasteurella multocida]MEB3501389.1 terminase small subunit [Pasteurella multocida]WRK02052.1 terminase small subunit [Pasteurella multocida]HDR1805538.1 LuxR family transcriptional regulator [Pasteurella multocida]HDR1901570.1 LuxR family transcriptional regulator [Pasteurella multocida]
MKRKTKPKIEIDLARVEALASNGLTQQQIADALGISERTLRDRKSNSADFADAIKRGKAKGIAFVTNKLMEQIKSGNTTAMIFFLKSQAGWKEKQEIDLTNSDNSLRPTIIELVAPEIDDVKNSNSNTT